MNKVLITSSGRTATVSLNTYLNKLSGVVSHHERNRQDVPFLFYSQLPEFKTITAQHLLAEDTFAKSQNTHNYVAVNPYFRFAGPLMATEFNWRVAHIVRHPKSYLESVYKRGIFTQNNVLLNQLPADNDPFSAVWNTANRFQKLCWYYSNTLTFFAKTTIPWYTFESITQDPTALSQMLTDLHLPTGLDYKGLEIKNTAKSLKSHLVHLKSKQTTSKPEPLNWAELDHNDMAVYHDLLANVSKHFGYVL